MEAETGTVGHYDHRRRRMKTAAIAFVVCLASSFAQAADVSGVPRIVDGDTLAIGATKVRLQGVEHNNGCCGTCGGSANGGLSQF
jgi:endonuclease YncB( thermonuclease family)